MTRYWVEMHPEKMAELGIERGDILEVRGPNGAVRAPAVPFLGIRPDTVAMALGQGHRASGSQGTDFFEHGDDAPVQWGYGRHARGVGVNPLDVMATGQDNAGGFAWTTAKVPPPATARARWCRGDGADRGSARHPRRERGGG